jgi:hypothetical protein
MAFRRLLAAALATFAIAGTGTGTGAAAPAERGGSTAKPPTRLWYRLALSYRLTTKTASEGYGGRNETERNLELHFGADEAVLLRKSEAGLGFLSNGMGSAVYLDTMMSTSYGKPAECPPSVGIRHTRAFGPGAAIMGRDAISFRWIGTRGDVVGNTTTSFLGPDPAGGPPRCDTLESSWTRKDPFPQLQIPWQDVPASARRAFGRRSLRFTVTRKIRGGEWTLRVFLDRCPGTAPCAGEPPKPPPGFPPPPD